MQDPAAATTPAATNTVIDVLRAEGNFSTLLSALERAQLTETLSSRTVSIFAPTDAAFAALPEAERTRLMDPANVNELRQVLLYHVIVADVERGQIEGARGPVRTAADTEVQLDGTGGALKIDRATIVADADASNGAVFTIDQVLVPGASQVAAGDAEATDNAAPAVEAAPAADDAVTAEDATVAAAPAETDTMSAPPASEMQPEPQADPEMMATPPASPPTEGEEPQTDPADPDPGT